MATFVLVHGGWHGGWCWKKVTPLLVAAGHAVHTPTLTGLGERADLAHAEIGIETHVRDIVGVLDCEDLRGRRRRATRGTVSCTAVTTR